MISSFGFFRDKNTHVIAQHRQHGSLKNSIRLCSAGSTFSRKPQADSELTKETERATVGVTVGRAHGRGIIYEISVSTVEFRRNSSAPRFPFRPPLHPFFLAPRDKPRKNREFFPLSFFASPFQPFLSASRFSSWRMLAKRNSRSRCLLTLFEAGRKANPNGNVI